MKERNTVNELEKLKEENLILNRLLSLIDDLTPEQIIDVDKAIELAPENINYHILRAELLKDLGLHDAARRCRRKISKMMATPQR